MRGPSGRAVSRVILGAAAVAAIVVGWAVVKRARTAADPAARAGDGFFLVAAAGEGELEVVRNLLKDGVGVDSSLTEDELRGWKLSDLDIAALPGTTALMVARRCVQRNTTKGSILDARVHVNWASEWSQSLNSE